MPHHPVAECRFMTDILADEKGGHHVEHWHGATKDGKTSGTPARIWSVRVGDELFVRGHNGTRSSWYQSAIRQKAGKIEAIGKTKGIHSISR